MYVALMRPVTTKKRDRMNAEYYICWYHLDGQDRYLIWYTNEEDGILLRKGEIPVFSGQDELIEYAASNAINLQAGEPRLHDLDIIATWLKCPNGKTVNCHAFNAAWNLFADLSRSVRGEFDPNK